MAPASTDTKATTTRSRARTAKPTPKPAPEAEPKPPPQLQEGGGPADDDLIVIPKPDPTADTGPAEPAEMVPIFSYDGTTYSMPKTVTSQQSLRAVWELKQHGDLAGGMQIIADILGADALNVLLTAPGVDDGHIIRVIDKITDVLFLQGREATKN